jgi:murein DD-endopeptidase MepM/ murein hydrolase activator NlpD
MVRTAFVCGLATMGVFITGVGASRLQRLPTRNAATIGRLAAPMPPAADAASAALAARLVDPPVPARPAANARIEVAGHTAPLAARAAIHFRGRIQSSLFEAAKAQGVPAGLLHDMIGAMSYDVDFQRDLQPDDQFELMAEPGTGNQPDRLLFASLTLSGKTLTLFRFVDRQGTADYYSDTGESVRKALLRTPVDGARISSGFGRRLHPILHYSLAHKGIDFAVMTGTPVVAAGSGVVEFAGVKGSYGLYLRIRHDGDHATAYAHLSRLASGMRPGKRVTQGQTVAFSGASGRATGPHLHYEVLIGSTQTNPMTVHIGSGRKLVGQDLAGFQSQLRRIHQMLAPSRSPTRTALNGN